jgi:glucokinase
MNLLGIDIGGTKTAVCLGNERGEIVFSKRIPTTNEAIGVYRAQLIQLCQDVLKGANVQPGQLDGIGISAPGPLDCRRGILLEPPNNPGWKDVPILDMVKEVFAVPVFVNNDANACALAEWLFGGHRSVQNLVYLTFSTGMGGGIILNGELVQGPTDTGGEVGHMVLDPAGPPCGCGQRGCWEAYVGGRNVAENLKEKIRRGSIDTTVVSKAGGIEKINIQAFEAAARDGDPFAVAEWGQFTDRVAQGIGALIMVLNPEVVVLGTIGIRAGEFVMRPIREKLAKYAWEWPRKACQVVPSSLGDRIGDLSALAVAVTGLDHARRTSR